MSIVKYHHHGREVSVIEELKGKHRDNCLCHSNCVWFKPGTPEGNCPVANLLYAVCIEAGITAPIYECPLYREE